MSPKIAALAAFLASALSIDPAVSKPVCPADFPVVGECFTIHGRLTISASLRPRIWRIGTKRLLQVEWKADDENSGLTPTIAQTFRDDLGAAIFGNFALCPVSRDRPGHMQFVCMKAATNLVVVPSNRRE